MDYEAVATLAGISWDPTIRGLLSVVVAVVVLPGSVYLILGTNLGSRLGFVVALAGFFGWMAILGFVWWIYGKGYVGESPSWNVVEINRADLDGAATDAARDLPDVDALPSPADLIAENPDVAADAPAESLGDVRSLTELVGVDPGFKPVVDSFFTEWDILDQADPARGEAVAAAEAALLEDASEFQSASDYLVLNAFERGGKDGLADDPSRIDRIVHKVKSGVQITHPTRYAVVQVRGVVPTDVAPGEAPPRPVPDAERQLVSVIMVRDLGALRFPPAAITIGSLVILLILCDMLHRRDKQVTAHLEAAGT